MAKFVIPAFSGMAPRYADQLLSDSQASFATNIKVTNGDLRGFRGLKKLTVLAPPPEGFFGKVKKLYRPRSDEYTWYGNVLAGTCIVNGPLVNDAFDRVYITTPGWIPVVRTFDDIRDGNPTYYPLGVPRPGGAPAVGWGGGGTGSDIRAYVYTFRTAFGETGMPSDPALVTVPLDIPINILVPAPNTIGFNVTAIDIYRTATGGETAGDYFRVGTVTGGTTTFADSMALDQVPLQLPLTSETYAVPPSDLQGLTRHSSGALVGYSGNQVCFSEPFLPHAWPEDYRYTVANPINAIAGFSNAIAALTTGYPTVLSGNHPSSIGLYNLTDVEPCVAARSVVSIDNSVLYASPNGLIEVSPQGLRRLTNEILTMEEWIKLYTPGMVAVKYGSWYLAITGAETGFIITLPPFEPMSFCYMDRYSDMSTLETDERDGNALLVQRTKISQFDALSDRRLTTTWTSKEFIAPKPINLGAYQVLLKGHALDDHDRALTDAIVSYNQARFALGKLDTLGLYAIGSGVDPVELGSAIPVPSFEELQPAPVQPVGGEPLFDETDTSATQSLRLIALVDGVEKYAALVADEKVHKLPSGFKGTRFYFRLEGNREVQRVVVAETAKECADA